MAITADVCEKITASIIAELEKGVMPWVKPWASGNVPMMPRRHTGESYSGVNILILWAAAQSKGYENPNWMTFKQALDYKAAVRKGETGTQIVFASKISVDETDSAGEARTKTISFLKTYTVFNAEQIDNLPERFKVKPVAAAPDNVKDWNAAQNALQWFDAVPAKVEHAGARAYFMPSADKVVMPARDSFKSVQAYLSTLAHELTHWSGHKPRLDREFGKRFGDERYAAEELVAELGAAFTMAELGMVPAVREDHAPYIASWIKVLKNDSRAILTAASKASEAVAYLGGFSKAAELADDLAVAA